MPGNDIDPTATMKEADNVEIITHGSCGTCDTRLVEGVQASDDTHFVACNTCAGLVQVVTDADQEQRLREDRQSHSTDLVHDHLLGDDDTKTSEDSEVDSEADS
jgi:hypothetical protein